MSVKKNLAGGSTRWGLAFACVVAVELLMLLIFIVFMPKNTQGGMSDATGIYILSMMIIAFVTFFYVVCRPGKKLGAKIKK